MRVDGTILHASCLLKVTIAGLLSVLWDFSFQTARTLFIEEQKGATKQTEITGWDVNKADILSLNQSLAEGWPHLEI